MMIGYVLISVDVMSVRMIDVLRGVAYPPPDKSGGYRMVAVFGGRHDFARTEGAVHGMFNVPGRPDGVGICPITTKLPSSDELSFRV